MKRFFKAIAGFIGAFFIFAILSQFLILIGPIIAGLIIGALDLQPNPQLAKTMESAGNIFVLVASIYAGIKTYKIINGKIKNIPTTKNTLSKKISGNEKTT